MVNTQSQPYQIINTEDDFEIRLYPASIISTISKNAKTYKELAHTGFRKLASYNFGSNLSNKSMTMTSPPRAGINDSLFSMSFVMTSNYSMEDLSNPNRMNFALQDANEAYVAAIRFGGYAGDDKIKKYAGILESALREYGIEYDGNFRFLGYNPPYQFWGRQNDVIVSINW